MEAQIKTKSTNAIRCEDHSLDQIGNLVIGIFVESVNNWPLPGGEDHAAYCRCADDGGNNLGD